MLYENLGWALLLTVMAGLSTTVGSGLGLLVRKPGPRFMATTLGFAGGVMAFVSFAELLPEAAETVGRGPAYAAFFVGFVAMWLVDMLVPHHYIAERHRGIRAVCAADDEGLKRVGLFVALGVAIHNFPEGMATLGTTLGDVRRGAAVAIAIAVHNVPEGLAISVPVYAATGSRGKAFFYSFLAGVAEPLGAVAALLVLLPVMTPAVLAGALAAVAGLMVYIALDELVPASREYGYEHCSVAGGGAGMAVMALSLWLLGRAH